MNIRKATAEDAGRICGIYNYYILNTAVTFETLPVSEDEMRSRISDILESGDPYFVAENNGRIAGYYYLGKWKERSAYATTKEVTIYLDVNERGKGLGTSLMRHMTGNLGGRNIHALLAAICLPNEASVRLHEKFGFRQVSHMQEIGCKFGRWQDVGHWQLLIKE